MADGPTGASGRQAADHPSCSSHVGLLASTDGSKPHVWEMNEDKLPQSYQFSKKFVDSKNSKSTLCLLDCLSEVTRSSILGFAERTLSGRDNQRKFCIGSILLVGQSGSGCSSVVKDVAIRFGAQSHCVSCDSLFASVPQAQGALSQDWGHRAMLNEILHAAVGVSPCILLIEDLHLLVPKNSGVGAGVPEATVGIVHGLVRGLTELQGGEEVGEALGAGSARRLLIVGTCHSQQWVDSSVLAAFQETVHFPLPSAVERRAVVAREWHRQRSAARSGDATSTEVPQALHLLADGLAGLPLIPLLITAAERVKTFLTLSPTSAQTNSAVPVVTGLDGICGLHDVKQALAETVLWPRRHPQVYRALFRDPERRGVGLSSGILLFGPPGTGKTLLPRALSEELRCALVNVRLSEVLRGEVGTSERRLRELFADARRAAPAVVFIDEFQALFSKERGVDGNSSNTLSAALAGCLDDVSQWNRHAGPAAQVTVIAATNEPWAIEAAFLRPGRLDQCLFVGPLGEEGRVQLLARRTGPAQWVREVAARTEGFTGADLALLCDRAESCAAGAPLTFAHFQLALQTTAASTTALDLREFGEWLRLRKGSGAGR